MPMNLRFRSTKVFRGQLSNIRRPIVTPKTVRSKEDQRQMTWNDYSPTPQCSNLLPYTFWLVPPLLNLGSPETLHTCEQAQPNHETYATLGFILFIMLAYHRKASLLMRELWKIGAYQDH